MQLSIDLDSSNYQSLQAQIFESIRKQILSGRLKPDTLLPSTRLLSDQLKVSRNTVVLAYDLLIAEDYICSHGTTGTFVSAKLPESSLTLVKKNRGKIAKEERHAARHPVVFDGRGQELNNPNKDKLDIDFWIGRPDPESFPINHWRQLTLEQLRNAGSNMTEYNDPAGILELRQAIADHLLPARGMEVDPEQVIIVNGSQEALNIVARLFVKQGTSVVTENPCYQGAAYVLESYGAKICPVNVDKDGLDVSELPSTPTGMVYVTPSHQYPMGSTLTLNRRIDLLEWAREAGAYIVEDDYDSDFRHHSSPLTALAGQDPYGCVIYIGTFSKSIGAGIRIGYMVLPHELVKVAKTVKTLIDNGHAWLDQAVLAEFISSGAYVKHLRRIRHVYVRRRDCLVDALNRCFGNVKLFGLEGGTHLVWEIPQHLPDASQIKQIAEDLGMGIYTIESATACEFGNKKYNKRNLIFGYSSVPEDKIVEGIARLANALEIRDVCNK